MRRIGGEESYEEKKNLEMDGCGKMDGGWGRGILKRREREGERGVTAREELR
jgi:hypothetical protein